MAIVLITSAFKLNTEELVLQFNNQSTEKRYSEIEKIITASKGVVVFEYCKSLNCFMITINRVEMPDDSRLLNELKQAGFSFDIKSGSTIAQVKMACRDNPKSKAD